MSDACIGAAAACVPAMASAERVARKAIDFIRKSGLRRWDVGCVDARFIRICAEYPLGGHGIAATKSGVEGSLAGGGVRGIGLCGLHAVAREDLRTLLGRISDIRDVA